ncbi:MAG: glycosyltransferase family 9 protein [Phycisphaerae bacterium]|nr:glycosyltransferase family 9 protein [Phycisphaerae bacterium]
MVCSQNKILKLGNGWSGRVVLSDLSGEAHRAKADSGGGKFSITDWSKSLSQPELLFEDTEKILKTEGRNCVAVKNLAIGNTQLKVVIKRHYPQAGPRQFFRSFRKGRALRNFDTALKLISCGIPVAAPFAALHKRTGLRTSQSIYITEFFEDSFTLYNFANEEAKGQLAIKKQLGSQLAVILAAFHKNGLWHRDSKAGNFIVCRDTDGKCKISLIDTDGIKPYRLRREACRFRSLWQLAASLLSVSAVNRTDYLRTFTAYANLTGLEPSRRRAIYHQLSILAKAKHRRSTEKNILLIKPSALGDIVLALPALSALRKSFPKAKISWLVRPEFAPLLKNHPYLDEIIVFDRKFLGKAWYHPRAFASLVSLIYRLNRSKFDIVIDLQGLFRTAIFAWLSGCRKRFGMTSAREFGHIFYTRKISQDKDCIHLVDYYLKIVRTAGAWRTDVQFLLPADPVADAAVERLLKTKDIAPAGYACFVPGSAHADKCWPVERFADLADRVSRQFGLSIIATGSNSEKIIAGRVKNLANVTVTNLAGVTSLSELIALLRQAKLVVSNDTGPGHIAAALNVPVVLLFGRSNPARVAPYARPNCVAAVEPDGRGFNADSADPKHDIKAITVDEVYQKVCEQLDSR